MIEIREIKAQCIYIEKFRMRTFVILTSLLFSAFDLELIIDIYHGVSV